MRAQEGAPRNFVMLHGRSFSMNRLLIFRRLLSALGRRIRHPQRLHFVCRLSSKHDYPPQAREANAAIFET
jgi:hypothetical protein